MSHLPSPGAARSMAWELNLSWWTDISFTELVQKLGEEKVKEVLPDYPENAPTIIPNEIKNFAHLNRSLIETDKSFRSFMGISGTHIGSNSWVVNAEKSESGKPIIANDPHLAFSAPGKWYAAVIKIPGWNVAGVSLPGVPGIVIGKNDYISWTLTNIMSDDTDFYYEQLDSTHTKYLLDGNWEDLEIICIVLHYPGHTDTYPAVSPLRGLWSLIEAASRICLT